MKNELFIVFVYENELFLIFTKRTLFLYRVNFINLWSELQLRLGEVGVTNLAQVHTGNGDWRGKLGFGR